MRLSLDEALRQSQELDEAYARADAFDQQQTALWYEWANMIGITAEDDESYSWRELHRAALNHRGQP